MKKSLIKRKAACFGQNGFRAAEKENKKDGKETIKKKKKHHVGFTTTHLDQEFLPSVHTADAENVEGHVAPRAQQSKLLPQKATGAHHQAHILEQLQQEMRRPCLSSVQR